MNHATARKATKTMIDALAEVKAKVAADAYSFDCSRCDNTGENLAGNIGETCWTCQGKNIGTRGA